MADSAQDIDTLLNKISQLEARCCALEKVNSSQDEEISRLKKSLLTLSTLNRDFQSFLDQTSDFVYFKDIDSRFRFCSQSLAEITGHKNWREMFGKHDREVFPADTAKVYEDEEEAVFKLGKPLLNKINPYFDVTGKPGSVLTNKWPLFDEADKIVGIFGISRDITERLNVETELRQCRDHLEELVLRRTEEAVELVTNVCEMRDPYTVGHERRVAHLAVAIGVEMGLDAARLTVLMMGGYLHDIGKVAIPIEILSKPGRITGLEYEIIKTHPRCGYDVLQKVKFPWPVAEIALQHHECLDGTGYPQGLAGEGIMLEARIIAVADVIEAMSSHRPYRPGCGVDKALAELERGCNTSYDPEVVYACLRLFRENGYVLPV